MDYPVTVLALRNRDFLKLFKTQCIRKKIHLLELTVSLWDVNDQAFQVGPHILKIEMEDIYFLTGLSKRGEELDFSSHRESEFSTEDYIKEFYREGTLKVSGKIPIKYVCSLPLCTILFTITNLAGCMRPHLALKYQMEIAVESLETKLFNWSYAMLINLKDQLRRCRTGKQKQFGYGSILVSLFFEKVRLLQ